MTLAQEWKNDAFPNFVFLVIFILLFFSVVSLNLDVGVAFY